MVHLFNCNHMIIKFCQWGFLCVPRSVFGKFWFIAIFICGSVCIINYDFFIVVEDQVQWVWIGIHVGSLGFCFIDIISVLV